VEQGLKKSRRETNLAGSGSVSTYMDTLKRRSFLKGLTALLHPAKMA